MTPDHATLLPLLPEALVGEVERIDPITLGLSGAGVYAVTAARGAFVLRIQARQFADGDFAQQVRILLRASEAGVAPQVVHVDPAAHAVVSARVPGVPMAAALADPSLRMPVLGSLVDRLRTLHALDPSGVTERDPIAYARAAWEKGRGRSGFPPWAVELAPTLESLAATLAADPRRVVSHNDVNPVNVMWDGARTWLVDWEVAGLGHPYFDLATVAVFLRMDDEVALALVLRHDGAALDERSRATFRALRRLVGILCGLTFLGLVDDLGVRAAPTRAEAPSLGDCYDAMRSGALDLASPRGRASMGLALLAEGLAP